MSTPGMYAVPTEVLEQRLLDLAATSARIDKAMDAIATRLAERGVTPRPTAPLVLPSVDELLTRADDVETYHDGMR